MDQTRYYNEVHCASYINKIVAHHKWQNDVMRRNPIPIQADNKYQKELHEAVGPSDPIEQKALKQAKGFNYRQAIGELIYAHTICRIDVSIAIITLSQFVQQPAAIHYNAMRHLFGYLNATKHYGLIYWREKPRMDLPNIPDPTPILLSTDLEQFEDFWNARQLIGSCDSTWASDQFERRSMGGVILMFAGAAIYYKTRSQPTIARSSTEAEFCNMADAGKAGLYIRWILKELRIFKPNQLLFKLITLEPYRWLTLKNQQDERVTSN